MIGVGGSRTFVYLVLTVLGSPLGSGFRGGAWVEGVRFLVGRRFYWLGAENFESDFNNLITWNAFISTVY